VRRFLFGVRGGDCGVSHQAHPQRSKSRSEAKGTCDSALRARGGDILFALVPIRLNVVHRGEIRKV